MKRTLLALLVAASLFGYEAKDVEVEFTAFKTPLKVGVKGGFDDVKLTSQANSDLKKMFLNTSVTIDTSKVNTKNGTRDAKIVKFFFGAQNIKTIQAKIVDVQKNTLTVAITMNNKTLQIPMKMKIKDHEVEAKGVIDLADFGMLKALQGINKACYVLHKGKTWQDVAIEFELQYTK